MHDVVYFAVTSSVRCNIIIIIIIIIIITIFTVAYKEQHAAVTVIIGLLELECDAKCFLVEIDEDMK
jgi:hypothetical protein